jgi:hypothetical protein
MKMKGNGGAWGGGGGSDGARARSVLVAPSPWAARGPEAARPKRITVGVERRCTLQLLQIKAGTSCPVARGADLCVPCGADTDVACEAAAMLPAAPFSSRAYGWPRPRHCLRHGARGWLRHVGQGVSPAHRYQRQASPNQAARASFR